MAFSDTPRRLHAPQRYIKWYIAFLLQHPQLAREYYPSDNLRFVVDSLENNEHIDTDHPPALRRHSAGLGYDTLAVEGRNLLTREKFNPTRCFDAALAQFFCWNAGKWERRAYGDALTDLIHSQWHIGFYQEASADPQRHCANNVG